MFTQCPKCNHTPLPRDQAFPAACPGCGVILAKVGTVVSRPQLASSEGMLEEAISERASGVWALLTHVPERVDAIRFWGRVALFAFFAIWGLYLISLDHRTGDIGASFIHRPLLIFHEAGHVIFRLFGEWMMVAGGTLMQLIMPLVLGGALLLKNRDPFGASIGLWLFGVSILDVAPYVYDAKVPLLTLLGGQTGEEGGHDWIYLLSSMGLLAKSQSIGWMVHKAGAIVLLVALAWGAWLLTAQRRNLAEDVLDET